MPIKLYTKFKKHARQIRDQFLEDRAEHLASTKEITKAAAVRQILCAERQTITFRKLGTWLKGQEYAQLTHVLVPDDPTNIAQTTWMPIVDAHALHQTLTSEEQIHYCQAAETPLVKGPFAEKNWAIR